MKSMFWLNQLYERNCHRASAHNLWWQKRQMINGLKLDQSQISKAYLVVWTVTRTNHFRLKYSVTQTIQTANFQYYWGTFVSLVFGCGEFISDHWFPGVILKGAHKKTGQVKYSKE